MKTKMLLGLLALLGLCGSVYAQIMSKGDSSNEEFCESFCQPNESGFCTLYEVSATGEMGLYSCGPGVLIYDSEPIE